MDVQWQLCSPVRSHRAKAFARRPDSRNYEWTVPAGSTILGGQGSNYIIVLFGSTGGNISVRAMNDCDTSVFDSLDITVNSCRYSQEVNQRSGIKAYPNPTSGTIAVGFVCKEVTSYVISISDITGRELKVVNYVAPEGISTTLLDLSMYEKGIFLINIMNSDSSENLRIVFQ